MNRNDIEQKLNRDRAWLLETYAALSLDDLTRGVTPSEHDPSQRWSALDHLVHLAGIERTFNRMIERHIGGDVNPVGLLHNEDGTSRTREQILASVHRRNEDEVQRFREKQLSDVVALGQQARAETLALLARLTDEQLEEKLPGAPWSDGTVGGVIATSADHGRQHWKWVKDAFQPEQAT